MNELVSKSEKIMTTKEVAEALGVSVDTVQKTVQKLAENNRRLFGEIKRNSQGGYLFDEAQATVIKLELQNHSKVNALSPKTTLEKHLLIQQAMQLQAEMIEELQAENKRQAAKIEEDAPKVDFYNAVTESKDCIDMAQVAKVLNIKGLGRTKLFELLRKTDILNRRNIPYQKYVNMGYFRIIETSYSLPDGTQRINLKTVVFQKGVDFIRKVIKQNLK
jgi:phage antirepressor YoqD-like protein